MTEGNELFILSLIEQYTDMMYRHYIDCIGDDDYIVTKIRIYGELTDKLQEAQKFIESL